MNLNIHYNAPDYVFEKLKKIYESMPNWKGFYEGFPYWYGGPKDEEYITVSVEPSGLQIISSVADEAYQQWTDLFIQRATVALGYPIGEPEEGYDFKYYNEEA